MGASSSAAGLHPEDRIAQSPLKISYIAIACYILCIRTAKRLGLCTTASEHLSASFHEIR